MEQAKSNRVYVATLTAAKLSNPLRGVVIYRLRKRENRFVNLVSLQSRFLQVLYSVMPDIVHVHGCWSYVGSKICIWSKNRNFDVIISPHEQLNQDVINDKFWSKRLPAILFYQRKQIKRASALFSNSNKETKSLKKLGWNRRIEMPLITEEIAMDAIPASERESEGLYTLYQKVTDSTYYQKMHEHEKAAFSALLHTGLAEDDETRLLNAQSILNLRNLNLASWRRIFLLATDQDVLQIVETGITRMQLSVPNIHTASIARYGSKNDTATTPLSSRQLFTSSKKSQKQLSTINNKDFRAIYVMLENIKALIRSGRLRVRHLCDYYSLIRHIDIDEDTLLKSMKSVGDDRFMGRIHQVLQEMLYLEPGFMPVAAIDDRGTEKIRKKITHFLSL
ncbi:MAG: hypothetical protein IKX36_08625 [Prevotella sp.]|nr:hypothetical protein [Prevotella sp.]